MGCSCLVALSVLCSIVGPVTSTAPEVCAWIVTPEADRKVGHQVEMRCLATSLESNYQVEWSDRPPDQVTYDYHLLTSSSDVGRYGFRTEQAGTTLAKFFTISDLRAGDTGEYFCSICEVADGLKLLLGTSSVELSVLYFPNAPFPVCFSDGPLAAVHPGTELNLLCSSESGNSAVAVALTQTPTRCSQYRWTSCSVNETVSAASLTLVVGPADDGTTFKCSISSVYFPEERRSCTIGPIRVAGVADAVTEYTAPGLPAETSSVYASEDPTEATTLLVAHSKPDDDEDDKEDAVTAAAAAAAAAAADGDYDDDDDDDTNGEDGSAQVDPNKTGTANSKTCPRSKSQPSPVPWMAAFLATFLLLVVSMVLNVLLLFRNLKPKRLKNNNLYPRRLQPPQPQPNIELYDMDTTSQRPRQPEENSYEETEN